MSSTLEITLPATLTEKRQAFALFLASIWQALPRSQVRRLSGLPEHIALEIHASAVRISYLMWAPTAGLASVIARQARAHFPDIGMETGQSPVLHCENVATAELHLGRHRALPLRTLKEHDPDPMAGVLAGVSGLRFGEWALIQILARPALAPEVDGQAFECLIRVACGAEDPARMRIRLRGIIAAFGQFADGNALRPTRLRIDDWRELEAIQQRAWPKFGLRYAILTRDELAAIYHFPSPAQVRNRYLDTTSARRLPLLATTPRQGVGIGLALSEGRFTEAHLDSRELMRHLFVVGATGTGKSTLLSNMVMDLAELGAGATVIEPHGSLISSIAESLPEHRLRDVALVRFGDVDFPVGLNLLSARPGFEFLTVDELVEICQRIYVTSYWGPVLDMTLRHIAYATLETGGTLVEMARLLDDNAYRLSVLRQLHNPETRRFLSRLSELREGRREQHIASTLHRLQRFLGTPFVRNIVGQRTSRLDIREIMDQRRILLVDLSGVGVDNARFLGSLLTLLFRQAALSREEIPEAQRAPHYLILDECSWFLSKSIGEMADQARKFGLGLVLAAQRLGQLSAQGTLDAILAEVGSLICFRMGDVREARELAQHLNTGELCAEDIRSLGQYEIYAQLLQRGAKLPAFWAKTMPPPEPGPYQEERRNYLICQSRETYARPREDVERELIERERSAYDVEPEKRKRQTGTPVDAP